MTSDCVHHFILPIPDKDEVPIGVCKLCGNERKMFNVIPQKDWGGWRKSDKKTNI